MRRTRLLGNAMTIAIAICFTNCSTTTATRPTAMLDLKITNGRILDGSGSPWRHRNPRK